MKRRLVFGTCMAVILGIGSCTGPDDEQHETLYANVDLEVSAAAVNIGSLARALSQDPSFFATALSDTGLIEYDIISFTPTEVLMDVQTLTLFSEWSFDPSNNQYLGVGDRLELPIDTEIDLVSVGSLNTLFDYTYSISDTFFNKYVAMHLDTGLDLEISGVVHTRNATYTLDHAIFTFGGLTYSVFQDTVIVDPDHFPTVRIIFDAEKAAFLDKTWDAPLVVSSALEDSMVGVHMEGALMLAFEGTEAITIERYAVTLAPDLNYHVQVVLGIDPDDAVRMAAWSTVFEPGFNELEQRSSGYQLIQPAGLVAPYIHQNADQSYVLKIDRDLMPLPPDVPYNDRELIFESFRREDHSGTLTYGLETLSYTAVELSGGG
ncbi:hypothetical protein ACFL3H_07095 [Gemmatimonadota bacterium]